MHLRSINPYDGQELAVYNTHTPAEVDQRLDAADAAFAGWRAVPVARRAEPMLRLATLLEQQRVPLAQLISAEMGKLQTEALAEIDKCAACCRFYAEESERLLAPEPVVTEADHSYLRYQPLGVILAIMPWNFPFWQVFRFLVPVLMAGNAALLKHAGNVTGCARAIAALLQDAGFPEGLFAVLQLSGAAVEPVIADRRIRGVAITGSPAAGARVGACAGQALKPSVLELGGSDPFVVLADADLDVVIPQAIRARYSNAGQVCIAAKRFLVEQTRYAEFLERLKGAAASLRYGDPQAPDTTLAPLSSRTLRTELEEQLAQAFAAGARLELGGSAEAGPGYGFQATILSGVTPDNPVFMQELFGPVAQVLPFSTHDEAIDLANATPFGLGASVWSAQHGQAEALGRQLQAGAVFINSTVKSDLRLPFGGTKGSGYGRELAEAGLRSFCNRQAIWVERAPS